MQSRALYAAGSLLALISATPALAQNEQAPPPDQAVTKDLAADQAAAEEETIVVTAQLREQRPVEIPFALSTFTSRTLEDLNIQEFEDLARYTPGFAVQNQSPNNPAISIRGITVDSGFSYFEPRVSIYQDGVSIAKPRGAYVELFDVERVEISKGPQSTLYGRGALIGAVNIVQAKPDLDSTYGRVRGEYGNFDYWLAEAMLNAAISPQVGLRVSGRYKKRDGYVESLLPGVEDFNSIETGAARAILRVEPSDKLTFDLIGNYQKDTPSGTSFKSLLYRPTDPVTGEVLGELDVGDGAALAPGAGFEGGKDLGLDRKVWGLTGLTKYELSPSWTLNATTAYREFHTLEILDIDGTSLPIITGAEEFDNKQFSQDLRLTWDNKGPVTAFIGASYFHEKSSQRQAVQFDERTALAQIAGALNGGGLIPGRPATDPAPLGLFGNTLFTTALLRGVARQGIVNSVPIGTPDFIIDGVLDTLLPLPVAAGIAGNLKADHGEQDINRSKTEAFDIFGDVTWKVSDQFELGAGLRWTHDDKSTSISDSVLNGRSILGGFLGALQTPGLSDAERIGLLQALAVPGAATIPPSILYPVPLFGLTFQPTANNGDELEAKNKDNGFTWRLFGRYAPNDDTSFYAIYARGRRPEVLSALNPAVPFGDPRFTLVDAETVDSFEVGAKATLVDRKLYLDASLFYYKYDNFQTLEQVGTTFITTNAGKAKSYGLEAQLRYEPNRNLRMFANYAFNHARFKTGVLDGNRFRLAPEHSFSAGFTWAANAGPGRIDFTPAITYQSKVFFDDNNDRPELQQPPATLLPDFVQDEFQKGYALVSARLGYGLLADKYRVELFIENALDKEYIKDAGNSGDALGLPTFIAGEPRTYGIQLTARF
ncbi:TonB-dependent receptor [Sphingomonas sp. RB56-2]|uniref:TonB-dependent receptor n=1 Tax=Sphingomonas brevis TaxID=2908206 RepID=A0ABT0SAD3_9SPHN|nr:TonB-dependent receptor [Sphingomonas brevis]MCL6741036.1 TonB-dependent receptor [Sphingomonas brevis]